MSKLDLLDKKLLFLLMHNGRADFPELARATKTSAERVFYHIKKLKASGVINCFKVNVNFASLGYEEYNLYLKIKDADRETYNKVETVLKNHPYTLWVGRCIGDYDFRAYFVAKDYAQLKKIIIDLDHSLDHVIADQLILFRLKKYKSNNFLMFNYLSSMHESKEFKKTAKNKLLPEERPGFKTDKIDWQIIEQLSKDTRASYSQIAEKTKIPAENIKYRMKRLTSTSSPVNFSVSINYTKFGLIWWELLIKTTRKIKDTEIINYAINHAQTVNIIENVGGEWDFDITFYSANMDDADKYLTDLRTTFHENIVDYKILIVRDTFKNPQHPEGFFKEIIEEHTKKI
jgi:Lrp/AsnC family transcriptional regulator, leucine-responsive regulatory protein